MPARNESRYDALAMLLHWTIAALLVGNIALAWWFNTLNGPAKIAPVTLHRSIGLTVLILSLVRLGWRLIAPPPPVPASVTGWRRAVAHAVFVLFYIVMIGMPLSGWALTSAMAITRIRPITLFGLAPWPAIAPVANLDPVSMKQAHETFAAIHGLLAKLAYGLIGLHVAAALRHLLLLRDGVMGRMVPFLRAPAR